MTGSINGSRATRAMEKSRDYGSDRPHFPVEVIFHQHRFIFLLGACGYGSLKFQARVGSHHKQPVKWKESGFSDIILGEPLRHLSSFLESAFRELFVVAREKKALRCRGALVTLVTSTGHERSRSFEAQPWTICHCVHNSWMLGHRHS